MGKTIEESLPRNPEEGARMPEPGPQVNRVDIIETGPKPLPEPTRTFDPQSIPSARDDDRMGGPGSSG
jgi:hypothetical protein